MFGLDGVRCAQVVSNPMFGDLDLHAMEEADMQDDVKDSIHRYKTPTLLFRMPRISTQNLYNSFKHLLNLASIPQHFLDFIPDFQGLTSLHR